jgi:hypothetical protein
MEGEQLGRLLHRFLGRITLEPIPTIHVVQEDTHLRRSNEVFKEIVSPFELIFCFEHVHSRFSETQKFASLRMMFLE